MFLSGRSIWGLLELVRKWTQHFTQNGPGEMFIWTNLHLEPHDYRIIMLALIYVISMEFLSLSRRRSFSRNVTSGEERGEMAIFPG